MALVMHPTPLDGPSPRRSPRNRLRPSPNLSPLPDILTHSQPAVTRPRSARIPSLHLRRPKSLSAVHPSASPPRRDGHSARSRASTTSTAASSSSRTKPGTKKKSSLVVLAGTKRKRSSISPDHPDRPQYELVSASPITDSDSQTPRQLRYAKRQRLLTARSGNEQPASHPPSTSPVSHREGSPLNENMQRDRPVNRERVHRATTEGRMLSPPPSTPPPPYTQTDSTSSEDSLNTPCPSERVHPERPPTRPLPPTSLDANVTLSEAVPQRPVDTDAQCPAGDNDCLCPTFTPLSRLPVPHRDRRPDTTDQGLWKTACQERVEYLKDVYQEVFAAVLRAEALTAAVSSGQAPKSTATVPPAQAEFKLYTPSTCNQARVDAEGDTDMDVGYSSDWDSDEDEDEDDDFMMDTDSDGELPTYDAVVALDGGSNGEARSPRLPRLSSIRVYALEAVPEQTSRAGVPYMGRGTPVDRQRRADWASPPPSRLPDVLRFTPQPWTPTPPPIDYYAPAPALPYAPSVESPIALPTMNIDMGPVYGGPPAAAGAPVAMQMPTPTPFGMEGVARMEEAYGQPDALSWLDPILRAESASPSPPPAPTNVVPAPLSAREGPGVFAVPYAGEQGFATTHETPTSPGSAVGSVSVGGASASPTGCAMHATFLECLQSSGCAPFFAGQSPIEAQPEPQPTTSISNSNSFGFEDVKGYASEPSSSPSPPATVFIPPCAQPEGEFPAFVSPPSLSSSSSPVPAPSSGPAVPVVAGPSVGVGVGVGMFPDQELAQFVRSHLVPGSVTLSHALG